MKMLYFIFKGTMFLTHAKLTKIEYFYQNM